MDAHGKGNGKAPYIVIFPQDADARWHYPGGAQRNALLGTLAKFTAYFKVDKRRVHVAGFSQGGYISESILCGDPTRICSIATVSAERGQAGGSKLPPRCFAGQGGKPWWPPKKPQRSVFQVFGRYENAGLIQKSDVAQNLAKNYNL